ncbi:hypothetical protein MOV63_14055 [Neorhizobium sp. SHOUNA12A]|nr:MULTISPECIES: hypothetical protein [unclassified Neorhizobium]MCJ9669439.1 hypothetical protein [Neorhizobium sp. SHOUNA12B]MCJ9745536.1 hypothetical protein [Neorhizobium sp. SHOUNA12A]
MALNAVSTPEMALRMETIRTLPEKLFLLQTMADDRIVAEPMWREGP